MSFNATYTFAVFILGCIVITILIYKHKDLASRILGFSLFTLNYTVFIVFLYESEFILSVPFLFQTAGLFYYLSAPFLFLYVYTALGGRIKFSWILLLHLLPALICLIDLVPFFLSGSLHKHQILEAWFNQKEASTYFMESWLIPANIHYIARNFLALLYAFSQATILLRYYYKNHNWPEGGNKMTLSWLMVLTTLCIITALVALAGYIFFSPVNRWVPAIINVSIFFFCIILLLLFRPQILYGNQFSLLRVAATNREKQRKHILSDKKISQVRTLFQDFIEQKHYLKPGIVIREVSDELKIQPYILSAFINDTYNMHFNDLINYLRIQYIMEGLMHKRWDLLTLEAIAENAGFNNRTTFLGAFKKFSGMTPTAFIKKYKYIKDEERYNIDSL